MFKQLADKISSFVTTHPRITMYGISLGVTFAVGLAISYAMAPHDASAMLYATSRGTRPPPGVGSSR
jgi:hypothetical protein